MSENLSSAQADVLEYTTARAAQLGLLQRYATGRRLMSNLLMRHTSKSEDTAQLARTERFTEAGHQAVSFEATLAFRFYDDALEDEGYVELYAGKVQHGTDKLLSSSEIYMGGLCLPSNTYPIGLLEVGRNFEEVDVIFGMLRLQHQQEVGLSVLGKPDEPSAAELTEFITQWPTIRPTLELEFPRHLR